MERCPYCNEFMEISANSQSCTHLSIDPNNEWCCQNCDIHFDLNLEEVPTDIGIARPNPTPPSQNPSQNPSTESKGESKEESKSDSSTPTTPANPSPNFPPAQIALAKQVLLKLQEYQDFSKIQTSVIPIIESLQGYLARDFAK